MSPSFFALCRSALFQRGPRVFISTIPFQDARCGTAFPGNACPTVQDWGQVCRLEAQKLWRFRGIYHLLPACQRNYTEFCYHNPVIYIGTPDVERFAQETLSQCA